MKKYQQTQEIAFQLLYPSGHMADTAVDVIVECPVAISVGGLAVTVMIVTPIDLEDFVYGFALSEAIIASPSAVDHIQIQPAEKGVLVDIQADERQLGSAYRKRTIVGQSGCGICGLEALDDVYPAFDPVPAPVKFTVEHLFAALEDMPNHQRLGRQTGAAHAAAYFSTTRGFMAIREDVGRHNALDKLIGHAAQTGLRLQAGAVIMTSRCSVEIVQKAIRAKVALLITVSGATTLAVAEAKKYGLTLVTLARRDSMQIINDPHGTFC